MEPCESTLRCVYAYQRVFICSEERNQATAKLAFGFTRAYNEKIRKREARLTAKLAGFSSLVRKETKHCRIFAKQMYGQVTCVAGYRRFRPNVICHASKMHDVAPAHRRRRLCMSRGSRKAAFVFLASLTSKRSAKQTESTGGAGLRVNPEEKIYNRKE